MKKCDKKENRCSLPQNTCCKKEGNNCLIYIILFILLAIIASTSAYL